MFWPLFILHMLAAPAVMHFLTKISVSPSCLNQLTFPWRSNTHIINLICLQKYMAKRWGREGKREGGSGEGQEKKEEKWGRESKEENSNVVLLTGASIRMGSTEVFQYYILAHTKLSSAGASRIPFGGGEEVCHADTDPEGSRHVPQISQNAGRKRFVKLTSLSFFPLKISVFISYLARFLLGLCHWVILKDEIICISWISHLGNYIYSVLLFGSSSELMRN